MKPNATEEPNKRAAARLDLASVRTRLAATPGRAYWRGLDELAQTPEFRDYLHREFPRLASVWTEGMDRRRFLTLMGASLALAGLSGCAVPQHDSKIVPYVEQPDGLEPGIPLFFATAVTQGGYAQPVLVTSREGRPIKIEGNDKHPASQGAADAITQASLLSLYDPDRSQAVLQSGQPGTWDGFAAAATAQMEALLSTQGAGLRLLTGAITSPTLADQIKALLRRFPAARWCVHEAVERDNVLEGTRLASGAPAEPLYRFDRADIILTLDGDFLLSLPGHVRYASDLANRRRVRRDSGGMSRLYAVESVPTITGATADHRLRLPSSRVAAIAGAIASRLGITPASTGSDATAVPPPDEATSRWIDAAVADLRAHAGTSVVVVGERQPASVHALAHAVNAALGNLGKTVDYIAPVAYDGGAQAIALPALAAEMHAGQVTALVMLDVNPAYTAPVDLRFAEGMAQVPFNVHLGGYEDETAALCQWHIPLTHSLESWSDARAYDGAISIVQPLIAPFYDTRTAHDLVAVLDGQLARSNHDIVRESWARQHTTGDFDTFWRTALNDGLVTGTASTPQSAPTAGAAAPPTTPPSAIPPAHNPPAADGLEIQFCADPKLWDGRYANNGWLQELPEPLSKLTWDNAALISPRTAQERHLVDGDEVTLRYRGNAVTAPVLILPGHPDGAVTVSLGYGRTRAGVVGNGVGYNAYRLRTSDAPWFGGGCQLEKTGNRIELAVTHSHQTMEGRDIVRAATLTQFRRNPDFIHQTPDSEERPESLYPDWHYPDYAWAMSIDLTACIGCNACVVACQAENNIPVVGKTEVLRGREMHWIRIDRYYEGKDLDHPSATYFMPIPCMQCEKAPCELVCPVGATLHDKDGLNQQVYNRCVGTRYCSNNCPYKVRRFNFLQFSDQSPLIQLARNPEVTVRTRGVMEKCSYCVQRIHNAKITADKEDRKVRDGEIVTACAQTCPTQAIVFGNLADPNSAVSRLKREPHNYGLLAELDTRPRTTYLARITDPNPQLATE